MYFKFVTVFVKIEYTKHWATEIVNAFLFVKIFELKDIGFEIHPVNYAKNNP